QERIRHIDHKLETERDREDLRHLEDRHRESLPPHQPPHPRHERNGCGDRKGDTIEHDLRHHRSIPSPSIGRSTSSSSEKQKAPDDSHMRIVGRIGSDIRPDSTVRTAINYGNVADGVRGARHPATCRIIAPRPQRSSENYSLNSNPPPPLSPLASFVHIRSSRSHKTSPAPSRTPTPPSSRSASSGRDSFPCAPSRT